MDYKELQKRTENFAVRIVKFVQYINERGSVAAKVIVNKQLIRSGTGVASNYRAACKCKSRKDFISKMGTVVEESDETQFWLIILVRSGLIDLKLVQSLLNEAGELTAIMTASRNSAIKNQKEN